MSGPSAGCPRPHLQCAIFFFFLGGGGGFRDPNLVVIPDDSSQGLGFSLILSPDYDHLVSPGKRRRYLRDPRPRSAS